MSAGALFILDSPPPSKRGGGPPALLRRMLKLFSALSVPRVDKAAEQDGLHDDGSRGRKGTG